ncbi:MAG: amino acid carrier protein, partial [Verrucomicrobia bacterium]|nr:amino acid carrier protein [Verrucomicrobiota bacterium]
MLQYGLYILTAIESFFWSNIAFTLIMSIGIYFTFRVKFFQIRSLPKFFRIFYDFLKPSTSKIAGVHPIKIFFTSMGGMIGIGNIVGIVTALQIGGPGALFWVWMAALFGSIIKYAEIFLGLKYRVPNDRGGYDGGPIYFLKAAFKISWVPSIAAFLLCIYGIEVYQFNVLTHCLSSSLSLDKWLIAPLLLTLVLFAGIGGIKRIAKICSLVIPAFVFIYIAMSFWIIIQEHHLLPGILTTVIKSAFHGHAAVGGFAGSGILLAIQHGISRAAYSSDLGIGYDSIIQSESSTVHPQKQASLAIIGVFVDNFICTLSILIVLLTGLWTSTPLIPISDLVKTSLSLYFPYMQIFMPTFLFMTGYTTIIAYFCVGFKCARFISPRWGEKVYTVYACSAFILFSFFDPSIALLVMSLSGAFLLITNLSG